MINIIKISKLTLQNIDLKDREFTYNDKCTHYHFDICEEHSRDGFHTNSLLLGKKIIEGCSNHECEFLPTFNLQKKYESFIIGTDSNGNNIEHSCEPDRLRQYDGSNPDAPRLWTPIFFNPEVLTKYYSNTERYSVEDGIIRCAGFWSLKIDNNHSKNLIVLIRELGQNLSYEEQKYWKHYNVTPDSTISRTFYRRAFLGEWAEPEKADLLFKLRYTEFNSSWYKMYSWYFFLPLNKNDEHLLSSLRIPLNESQGEFDNQVSAITKIIIDCLNEKEIKKQITNIEPDDKGIDKLEKYLEFNKVENYSDIIKFFRNLQKLRSKSVAHRKGKSVAKIAQVFEMDRKNLSEVFTKILSDVTEILQALGNHFLNR